MKRVLSLVMMAVLAIGAWAAEETIELTAAAQGYNDQQLVTSVEGDVVTLTFDQANSATAPAYYSNGDAVRLYNGGTMKVSASGKTMTKIVFVYELNGSATVSVTPATYDASTKTWTGSATEVVMTAGTAKHVRISKVTVTYEDGDSPVVTVATPVIAGETPFTESTQVSITCATEGASIYYTIDGTAPTANSLAYSAPFTLTESATVKAIAYDANNNASSVASMEFAKEEPATIETVTLPYQETFENGFGKFYTNDVVGSDIWFTGSYNGTYYAKATSYKSGQNTDGEGWLISPYINLEGANNPQLSFSQAINKFFVTIADEATLWVKEKDATDWVQIEITYPAKPSSGYSAFEAQTIDLSAYAGKTIQIAYKYVGHSTGSGTWEVANVKVENVAQQTVAAPVITGETPFIGSTTVTIECETEDATIYYTIDGTEPTNQSTEYTAPFELAESATVKAIAYDMAGTASTVASKEFVKKISCATVAEILALDNNTEFTFTGSMTTIAQALSTNGNSKYLYAQDEEGVGMFLFNAPVDYSKGDVIPAGWAGKITTYKGAPEVTSISGMQAATETAELTATEMTPAEVTVDPYNLFHYAVIKGVSLVDGNITVGEESVDAYCDRFGVTFPQDYEGKTFDVYGIPSWYNVAQFMPLEIVEVVEKTASPVITVEEGDEFYVVTAAGDGEVKLYIDEMEVENPYVIVRTDEEQVFTFVATAQEEGKDVSDPTVLTIIVPKLEISEIEQLFVVGTFNNWSQETGMIELIENENNEFVGDVELEAGAEFKLFTPYGDGLKWFGGVDENNVGYFLINSDMLETPITLIEGANFRVEEAGNYNITVVEAESKGVQEPLVMTIKKNTPEAIEAINMENVKAVRYYNVAGVESATPFQGVNIVVREMTDGTKNVTKMMK